MCSSAIINFEIDFRVRVVEPVLPDHHDLRVFQELANCFKFTRRSTLLQVPVPVPHAEILINQPNWLGC